MASASEAQQLAAVAEALQQLDVVSIARLTRDATSLSVCEAGSLALAELSEISLLMNALASDEAQVVVEALTSALRKHPASAGAQRVGCRALGNLCGYTRSAEAVSTFAGACGAVEAVAAALRTHLESADVQDAACMALANLITGRDSCILYHTGNCDRAHRAGAFDDLLDVMHAHLTEAGVQDSGCSALASFSRKIAVDKSKGDESYLSLARPPPPSSTRFGRFRTWTSCRNMRWQPLTPCFALSTLCAVHSLMLTPLLAYFPLSVHTQQTPTCCGTHATPSSS